MSFGVAGAAHAEIVALAEIIHQFGGVLEMLQIGALEMGGFVAAQGEHILEFLLLHTPGEGVHVALVEGSAGEVHEWLCDRVLLDVAGQVERVLAVVARRLEGDADEVGAILLEGVNSGVDVADITILGIRGEDFEGEGFLLFQDVVNSHSQ